MSQQLLQAYEALPAEYQREVQDFIEFLNQKLERRPAPERPFAGLPGLGSMKGKIWMADDFDETPEDFKDYM